MFRAGDEAADNSVDPKFLDADKAIVAQVRNSDTCVGINASFSLLKRVSVDVYSSNDCAPFIKKSLRRNTFVEMPSWERLLFQIRRRNAPLSLC